MNTNPIGNSLANKTPRFSVAIRSEGYQRLINDTLGDPKLAQQFVADISTAVATNHTLQRCDAGTILSAGLVAYTLKLPLAPTLGYAYIIPYGDKASFQVGYKGLIQLAIRSGIIADIDVDDIREGEYLGRDGETGKPKFQFIEDEDIREKAKVVGYRAFFETTNGFRKVVYWSVEKIQKHAKRYSKTYGSNSSTNPWRDLFDVMAKKTVLKQLLSKWAMLSVELQEALRYDQAVIKDDKTPEYIDAKDDDDDNQDDDDVVVNDTNTTKKDNKSLLDAIDE